MSGFPIFASHQVALNPSFGGADFLNILRHAERAIRTDTDGNGFGAGDEPAFVLPVGDADGYGVIGKLGG